MLVSRGKRGEKAKETNLGPTKIKTVRIHTKGTHLNLYNLHATLGGVCVSGVALHDFGGAIGLHRKATDTSFAPHLRVRPERKEAERSGRLGLIAQKMGTGIYNICKKEPRQQQIWVLVSRKEPWPL